MGFFGVNCKYPKEVDLATAIVESVKPNSCLYLPGNATAWEEVEREIARHASQLAGVRVSQCLGRYPHLVDPSMLGHLEYIAPFIGGKLRAAAKNRLVTFDPVFLGKLQEFYANGGPLQADVCFIYVTPCQNGFFNLSVGTGLDYAPLKNAKCVVAIENPNLPWVEGTDALVHVSEVDYVVRGISADLIDAPSETDEISDRIGAHIASLIEDGSTIQGGIGGVPDAVFAKLLNHKDLGMHTELAPGNTVPLIDSGVITRPIHLGFMLGTKKLYQYADRNRMFEFIRQEIINDPFRIAQIEKFVSINSALMVDLFGQVYADSIGENPISGVGGQVDFVRGARSSKGGKSFIALASIDKKKGISKIVSAPPAYTPVTTSRYDVDYVVTENGAVKLHGLDANKRAQALISIADPSKRDELSQFARDVLRLSI